MNSFARTDKPQVAGSSTTLARCERRRGSGFKILPALNVCVHCPKAVDDHGDEKHEFERDASRPEWQGWHDFRRGLAAALHAAGVQDQTILSILRLAN
jgi:hypothetical protein